MVKIHCFIYFFLHPVDLLMLSVDVVYV